MTCESETLAKILYALETGNPYLFVDRLMLFRQQPMFQVGAQVASGGVLSVQFTLSGYLRQPGKGKAGP